MAIEIKDTTQNFARGLGAHQNPNIHPKIKNTLSERRNVLDRLDSELDTTEEILGGLECETKFRYLQSGIERQN